MSQDIDEPFFITPVLGGKDFVGLVVRTIKGQPLLYTTDGKRVSGVTYLRTVSKVGGEVELSVDALAFKDEGAK